MIKRLLFFFLLVSCTLSAQHFAPEDRAWRSAKNFPAGVTFGAKDSLSRVFVSIGVEWLNFYSFGKTYHEDLNWSLEILPLTLSLEVRTNLLERDSLHSLSMAVAPASGISLLNTNSDIMLFAGVPFFLQYNSGCGATRRAHKSTGFGIGFGPAFNMMSRVPDGRMFISFVSVDAQFTLRARRDDGRVGFSYFRCGLDPNVYHPSPGFHFDFGLGKTFGK